MAKGGAQARVGLDFFRMDVDILADRKIDALIDEAGTPAFVAYTYLLAEIYKEGYYVKVDKLLLRGAAKAARLDVANVESIVATAVEFGLFDEALYKAEGVLTSHGIQKRYYHVVHSLLNRKEVVVDKYCLLTDASELNPKRSELNPKCSELNPKCSDLNPKRSELNPTILEEKKRDKTKQEETKTEERREEKETPADAGGEILTPAVVVDDFEWAWEAYGKKGSSKQSRLRWKNLPKYKKKLAMEHIPQYVAATPDLQFRKNFEVYINQEVWNDRLPIYAPPKSIQSQRLDPENINRIVAVGLASGYQQAAKNDEK